MTEGLARQLTIGALLGTQALAYADHLAVQDGPMRISYAELDRRTDRLANALASRGVVHGDRIASMLLDGLPAVELLLAAGKLGAITVTLNWRLAAPELAYIVDSAQPRLLIHSNVFTEILAKAGIALPFIAIPDASRKDGVYEELVSSGTASEFATGLESPVKGEDPLYMLYTSGTTGRPKGCLHSHDGAITAALAFGIRRGVNPCDRLLSTSPLFHVGGLSHLFTALVAGAGTIIVARGLAPVDVLRLLCEERCTLGSPNDALIAELIELQKELRLPLHLRSLTRGASLTPASQIMAIREHLGSEVVGGYGQSEVGGFATMIDGEKMLEHPLAIGWPLAHLCAVVLDAHGVPDGKAEFGELGLRGPSVMLGYWNDEQASAEALGTGWLRTGDLVRRDETGRLHFAGRSKELIKTGGENVYPREVERVLIEHPAIADAAIVGVPHPRWGEAVKACIVVREGAAITPADVVAWCRRQLAGYKRPRFIEYVDKIPRDYLGKVQRSMLIARAVTPDQATD